jgi:hypothetical protein
VIKKIRLEWLAVMEEIAIKTTVISVIVKMEDVRK